MLYRELGKTGQNVSVIGLGCEHLDRKPYEQVKETIDAALLHGINIMDVFMPGTEVRENIAKALGNRRKQVMIQGSICSTDVNALYDISRELSVVKKYFENLLRIFGGYIDFGMLFFIDSEHDYQLVFDTGIADYVEQLKRQGDIRHIGFSFHKPEIAIKIINTGVPEMIMFSINPAFDMLPVDKYAFDHIDARFGAEFFRGLDPKRAELYKLCEQKQIGITAMKSFGAGKLLSREYTPFANALTVQQCIHYALSRPAVASVLPGCQTRNEVLEVMRYFIANDKEKDYTDIINIPRNDFRGQCVYCNHCQPCPSSIDIAAVNKYLDIASLDKDHVPSSIKSHYRNLAHQGYECTSCGSCETRCPFEVTIIDNMEKAEKLLGTK